MSILSELKKLTGKNNAAVISEALPDSLDPSRSGGDNEFIVTITVKDVLPTTIYEADKTLSEINEAVDGGKIVHAKIVYDGIDFVSFGTCTRPSDKGRLSVYTLSANADLPNVILDCYDITANGVTHYYKSLT